MSAARLARMRQVLADRGLDAFLVGDPLNRRYLTGFTGSFGWAVVAAEEAALLTDSRYTEQAGLEAEGWRVLPCGRGVEEVAEALRALGAHRVGFEADRLTVAEKEALAQSLPVEWVATQGVGEELRAVKEPEELALLQEAAALADRAFRRLLSEVRPGVREVDLARRLEIYMLEEGADGRAFPFIVASGPRGSMPHGVASGRQLERDELITFDFGAVYRGYASDCTRTVALGRPRPELVAIYRLVEEAQALGRAAVGPGVRAQAVDAAARDPIQAAGHGAHFGHSTGHGVGLAVHEQPLLSSRSEAILKPGMVVTVEPGVYVPGLGGVRIEDELVVTEDGARPLTLLERQLTVL